LASKAQKAGDPGKTGSTASSGSGSKKKAEHKKDKADPRLKNQLERSVSRSSISHEGKGLSRLGAFSFN
jgi:hypothetical protein